MRVLLIEDDLETAAYVAEGLRAQEIAVGSTCPTASAA